MNKTLSLCIIAKDADKDIRQCLESVKGLVDEIVLIDTGSTDSTKKIALEYGAKVYDYLWQNDFSDARNFSLSKVNTDWVLILDSDEILKGEKENLKEIINADYNGKIPIFFIDILTFTDKNNEEYSYYQKKIRLFPKNQNIKFEYSIAEEITHPEGIGNLISLEAKGLVIKHFLEGGPKGKSQRNVPILKRELKKNPKAFYYNYLMGKECLQHGFLVKAFTAYQNALKSEDEKESFYLAEICTDLIKILYKQGNREEALNECLRREKICENNPDYWLTYGYLAIKEGDFKRAEKCLLRAMEINPPAHLVLVNVDAITWKPELLLGYTYLMLKDYNNAKLYLEKAVEHNDSNWLLLYYLGVVCKNLKDYSSSEAYFKAATIIAPPGHIEELKFSLLLMLIMGGRFDKANDLVQSMVEKLAVDKDENISLSYDLF